MGTKKDFRVKTGLVVENGDVTLASDHSVKAGIFDTNIAAAGVTLTGTTLAADGSDTNIDINLTPKGSGEVNITKVDINAGTLGGITIDGNWTAASQTCANLGTVSAATSISSTAFVGAIDGALGGTTPAAAVVTTLNATGATTLDGAVTLGNATGDDITNTGRWVGDFVPKTGSSIDLGTSSLQFAEAHIDTGHIDALTVSGTSTLSSVDINAGTIDATDIGQSTARSGAFTTLSATGAVTVGVDGTGTDVTFHSATSGDYMLWDTSAKQLKIVGTASSVALDVDTGDFTVGAYGLTNAGAATIASMAGNWTNAGRTVADAGILTTVDINGGTVDGATIGANSATTGKFTTTLSTTHSRVGGTARETNSLLQVNGPALSGSDAATSMNYAEARIHTDIGNDDVNGTTYNGLGNAMILDNAENIHVGQGVVYTQGRSGTGNSWAVGRQSNRAGAGSNVFHIGYIAKDFDNIAGSAQDPLVTAQYMMTLDTSGTAKFLGDIILDDGGSLKEAAGTAALTFDGSGHITKIGQSTHTNGYVLKLSGGNAVWAASASGADGMGSGFVLEDGDGTEVTIDEDKEVKFIDGDGLEINWTDTDNGTDVDPYDLTFSLDIDGMTDIGAAVATGDLLIIDDGANGTNRKTTVDRIATLFAGTGISASSASMNVDAAQTAATSSMTSSTSRTITTPLLSIESTTASKPVVQIKNTTNDQTGSELRFVMDKGAAGAVNDVSGAITFYSDDAGQTNQAFGKIQTKTTAATAGSETGEIGLSVATSTSGALAEVLVITGGAAAATSTVDVKGHLIVRGTTTTVNSTTIDVADININLGNGIGDDAAVDGGGITLESSDSNKTFNWVDSTDAWTSSEHMNLLSGKAFKIAGTSVLNATTLGSDVVASSLTSVGTLTTLTVDNILINGTTIGHTGDTDIMTLGSASLTLANNVDFNVAKAGGLQIAGTAVTSTAAELNYNDTGSAVGTVVASKTLTVDASRDVATIRNLTSDGTVQGATLSADAVAIIDTGRGSGTTITGATSLMNIAKATYRAAKVLYHIKKDSAADTDAGEILITYNGTNAFLTHYAEISTGAVVGTWDATVSGANIEVRFTPTADGAHTYSLCTTQLIT